MPRSRKGNGGEASGGGVPGLHLRLEEVTFAVDSRELDDKSYSHLRDVDCAVKA